MASMAATQARGPLQASLGQLALVGVGAFCLANPEKFFNILRRGALFLLEPLPSDYSGRQIPIVISSVEKPTSNNNATMGYIFQVTTGAGLCWGAYMLLVNILPEAVLEMLPVTKSHFKKAVSWLEERINKVRDTLMQQMFGLSEQQKELSAKQDDTYDEVVIVKDEVRDLSSSLSLARESLDACQQSLVEAERRQSYIARGVRLLTRGVSSLLPQDSTLVQELDKFSKAGNYLTQMPTPLQRQLQQKRNNTARKSIVSPRRVLGSTSRIEDRGVQSGSPKSPSPENELPAAPVTKGDLDDIRSLLSSLQLD
jgi:hypothetical protein